MTLRLLGVVLCGGKSSRMGTDKSTLMHPNGKTFLRHSHDRLTAVCDQVIVSSNRREQDYITIVDPIYDHGPAVGVAAAVRHAHENRFDACLITPVDMPDLTVDDLRHLKQVWADAPDVLVCGNSENDQKLQPLVAIYPSFLVDDLVALARSKDRSLYRLISSLQHQTFPLSIHSCRNVNSPEDLS